MEQDREDKVRGQAEVWVEVAEVKVEEGVADKGEEEVLRPALVDIAFAPTVVKKHPINWGAPAMNKNAQSAEQP
jgi:hypothetical protein